jgi:hypothetical protein
MNHEHSHEQRLTIADAAIAYVHLHTAWLASWGDNDKRIPAERAMSEAHARLVGLVGGPT